MPDLDSIDITFKKTEIPWLQQGLELLANYGLHQFNVEKLSAKVGKAKTSYYFLFENQETYFRKLTLYWFQHGTLSYFQKIEGMTDPMKKFEILIEQIYADKVSGLAWLQIKMLEDRDPYLKNLLNEVQQNRLHNVASMYREIGKDPSRSMFLAKNFMYAYYGWLVLNWSSNKPDTIKKEELSELFSILELESLDLDFLAD